MSNSKLNLLKIIVSVLSSFIGIQSNENRKRDFNANKPFHFIIVGLVVTISFIIALYYIVNKIIY